METIFKSSHQSLKGKEARVRVTLGSIRSFDSMCSTHGEFSKFQYAVVNLNECMQWQIKVDNTDLSTLVADDRPCNSHILKKTAYTSAGEFILQNASD